MVASSLSLKPLENVPVSQLYLVIVVFNSFFHALYFLLIGLNILTNISNCSLCTKKVKDSGHSL